MANKLKFSNGRFMEEVQKYDYLYNKYSKEFIKGGNKKTLDHLTLGFSKNKRRHRLAQGKMLSQSSLKI